MILSVSLDPKLTKRYIIDDFVRGESSIAKRVYFTPEGGGMDIAKIVSNFNEEVFCIGLLGGRNGDIALEYLNNNLIDNNFITIENETRGNLSIVSEDGLETNILELSPRVAGGELERFYKLYKNSIRAADIICLSGEVPRGSQENIYSDLVILANEESKKVLISVSDEYLDKVLVNEPYLLNITLNDLENITGLKIEEDEDIIKLASQFLEGNTRVLAVYKGLGSYVVLHKDLAYIISLKDDYILNENGGRESFLAGFAVSELRNYDFEYKLKISIACHITNSLENERHLFNMKKMKSIMNELDIRVVDI